MERLIGIYLINNFIGGGMVEYVLDENSKLYTVIIINPETLHRNISDWITYRENSCFLFNEQNKEEIKIIADCGTKYTGLTYIILHETTHVVDYVLHYTPYVEPDMRELGLFLPETAFSKDIWLDYGLPFQSSDFHQRELITFYGLGNGPYIDGSHAHELYISFSKSPFTSLYGSQNWAEDLVEYFTWYYFCNKLQQPYKIKLQIEGQNVYEYEPIKSERVLKRVNSILTLMQ